MIVKFKDLSSCMASAFFFYCYSRHSRCEDNCEKVVRLGGNGIDTFQTRISKRPFDNIQNKRNVLSGTIQTSFTK